MHTAQQLLLLMCAHLDYKKNADARARKLHARASLSRECLTHKSRCMSITIRVVVGAVMTTGLGSASMRASLAIMTGAGQRAAVTSEAVHAFKGRVVSTISTRNKRDVRAPCVWREQ